MHAYTQAHESSHMFTLSQLMEWTWPFTLRLMLLNENKKVGKAQGWQHQLSYGGMSRSTTESGNLDQQALEVTIFPRLTYALSPSLDCCPTDGHHLENESKDVLCMVSSTLSPLTGPLPLPWPGETKWTSDMLLSGEEEEGKVPNSPSISTLPLPPFTQASSSLLPFLSHCNATLPMR